MIATARKMSGGGQRDPSPKGGDWRTRMEGGRSCKYPDAASRGPDHRTSLKRSTRGNQAPDYFAGCSVMRSGTANVQL